MESQLKLCTPSISTVLPLLRSLFPFWFFGVWLSLPKKEIWRRRAFVRNPNDALLPMFRFIFSPIFYTVDFRVRSMLLDNNNNCTFVWMVIWSKLYIQIRRDFPPSCTLTHHKSILAGRKMTRKESERKWQRETLFDRNWLNYTVFAMMQWINRRNLIFRYKMM